MRMAAASSAVQWACFKVIAEIYLQESARAFTFLILLLSVDTRNAEVYRALAFQLVCQHEPRVAASVKSVRSSYRLTMYRLTIQITRL